jgi:hypothetical protein
MSTILGIVFMTGAGCASAVLELERTTVAYQVPCAIVIRAPVGNPFKLAQQKNEIGVPPAVTTLKKATRCGGKKVIWLKPRDGKRRYRCAT